MDRFTMDRSTLSWLGWGSIGAGFVLIVIFAMLTQRFETTELRSLPLTWMLLAGVAACWGVGAYTFYKVEWQEMTGGAGGSGFYIIYLVVGIVLAFILTAAWQALR